MKAIILRTKPYSMFRLGAGSKDEVDLIIHSDTLFSAIINIHSKVYEDTEEFIKLFEEGKIKISSAFPILSSSENDKNIFFLPKPELDFNSDTNTKEEKKIKFISTEVYKKINSMLLNTQNLNISFTDRNYFSLIGSAYCVVKEELPVSVVWKSAIIISKEVTPKTKVYSDKQEDNFYHETNIQLKPIVIEKDTNNKIIYSPHFYFMYDLNCSEEQKNKFFTCLRVLADQGIGGERSAGKGQLEEIVKTEIPLELKSNSNEYMLLSLCNPNSQKEFDSFEKYEIAVRGGGSLSFDDEIETDEADDIKLYRKKQARMITEGAIVKGKVDGRLVDVSPENANAFEHNFYRNGKSFLLHIG
jgi:CRISPR-associated protein Csm4